MLQVTVYNFEGQAVGTRELPAAVFGCPVNIGILHQAVVAQTANARPVLAHTKTRGEVRGGGRKPWRQKGTGRARHGSIRSPLWIGGGITFGPRSNRNFRLKINARVRRQALLASLSAKAADVAMVVVDDLGPVDRKTKRAAILLDNLKLRAVRPAQTAKAATPPPPRGREAVAGPSAAKAAPPRSHPSVLVVLPPQLRALALAFRNLARVSVLSTDSLNVRDIVAHRYLVVPLAGLDRIAQVYGPQPPRSQG